MPVADRYDIQQPPLGAGAFGRVFRAIDRTTGRTVALKVLHRQDYDSRGRFFREAAALHSQFANDHVVTLIDHAGLNDADEPHIAIEFCELGSLRTWVGAGRSLKEITTAVLHAAKGLAGVHAVGGRHRDLKPENLLVARAPTPLGWIVKLGDFGLAGFPHPVTGKMTYTAFGTKGYIAPELYGDSEFHPGADVYALGVTAIELVVGRNDIGALATTNIPAELRALLQSMVSALPDRRPTAVEVVMRLEALLAPVPKVTAPSLPWMPNVPIPVGVLPQPQPAQVTSTVGENVGKAAVAIGVAAFLAWLAKRAFGGSDTYYDPNVERNRNPDGTFAPF